MCIAKAQNAEWFMSVVVNGETRCSDKLQCAPVVKMLANLGGSLCASASSANAQLCRFAKTSADQVCVSELSSPCKNAMTCTLKGFNSGKLDYTGTKLNQRTDQSTH